MAGLGRGHEKAQESYRSDGLRDTDVLTSPTLTNLNERGLLNGVVPVIINDYHSSNTNRLSDIVGNCAVSYSGTTVTVAAGTVLLDGLFYEVTSNVKDITASANQAYFPYNNTTVPGLAGADYERILLVYVDPTLSGFIGFTYGNEIDTGGGSYPSSPEGHLDRQTVVLASLRLTYSSGVAIASADDKRVFIRPGPLPLSALTNHATNGGNPANDLISGSQNATLPVGDMGFLFARNPRGLSGTPNGLDQTHLFFQSDKGLGEFSGGGGVYQLTPVHRTSIKTAAYTGSQVAVTLLYSPLASQDDATLKLVEVQMYKTGTPRFIATLVQGTDYTISANVVTVNGSLQYTGTPTNVRITYVHAGHTG